ncbi:MAG: bifunctional (p)ppGpp synthetase/guanosine-3',5'-bis(diphosphate) 3'-pyrophosphohydrolase [Candidatus Sumerlaeia bacterium]|nr:bifunctional (p)ppGpp synthetase/guanosine-3',5'-bis(diphosphate) 3'-pyrophosphohydrolase [Candidatus Sumerlaeia bacterium]
MESVAIDHPSATLPSVADILSSAPDRYTPSDRILLDKAYRFGLTAHAGQMRQSGDPYFLHCIEVARLLAELRLDSTTLAAGLLHDVLEDTGVTAEQLAAEFPAPIPVLVQGVTKISSLDFRSSRAQYVENLRKMILATAQDLRVVLIKICDRLHNMRTLSFLPPDRQHYIATDTMKVYAPLANRLGMMRIKSELEDLAMRYLYPQEYRRIAELVAEKRASREAKVERSISVLREHLAQQGLHPEIVGRPKHFYSIFEKMREQKLELDQIYDLIGLRVITEHKQKCYDIVGHIHALWKPIPGRLKDYIALPKDNGYQSLHTAVMGPDGQVIEIQIRTREMHRMAEEGIAAHWRYKEGGSAEVGLDEKLAWFRRMTDWLQEVKDPDEFMRALTHDVFADRVFVFSPRGDAFDLPRDSTPLDYAYTVHSEIGNRCVGAKVNNRIVPLRTPLQQGDVVEILTSKTAHPRAHWLEIVRTARARSKIRHWLRSQQHSEFVISGRERILKAVRAHGIDITADRLDEMLRPLVGEFHADSLEDLLADVGFGRIALRRVVDRIAPAPAKPRRTHARPSRPASEVLVDGMTRTAMRFAQCCRPLPGEPIVAFVTVGRGLAIHRQDCESLEKTMAAKGLDPSRRIPARWNSESVRPHKVTIKVVARDRVGLQRDICDAISKENISISDSDTHSRARGRTAILRFTVPVTSKDQMTRVMARIRSVPGVTSLTPTIHVK